MCLNITRERKLRQYWLALPSSMTSDWKSQITQLHFHDISNISPLNISPATQQITHFTKKRSSYLMSWKDLSEEFFCLKLEYKSHQKSDKFTKIQISDKNFCPRKFLSEKFCLIRYQEIFVTKEKEIYASAYRIANIIALLL